MTCSHPIDSSQGGSKYLRLDSINTESLEALSVSKRHIISTPGEMVGGAAPE
jgi:hypothetical protein